MKYSVRQSREVEIQPLACRILSPSTAALFHQRARNSVGHVSVDSAATPRTPGRSNLAGFPDLSPIFMRNKAVPTSSTTASCSEKTSRFKPISRFPGTTVNSQAKLMAKHANPNKNPSGMAMTPSSRGKDLRVLRNVRMSCSTKSIQLEKDGSSSEETGRTECEQPCSNANRILEVQRKLRENNSLLRKLSMSQSKLQRTVPSLFAYREEIKRLRENEDGLPESLAQHQLIATMVEMQMKSRCICSPTSLKESHTGNKFEEHMAASNLTFLLKLAPGSVRHLPSKDGCFINRRLVQSPKMNRTTTTPVVGLTPSHSRQPTLGKKTMLSLFLTSVKSPTAREAANSLSPISKSSRKYLSYDSNIDPITGLIESLEKVTETYRSINEQCNAVKVESERGLQNFEEAMKECQRKVGQTMGERLLVHIHLNERPKALVDLQRKASGLSDF